MHTKPMVDSEGIFEEWNICGYYGPVCSVCGSERIYYRTWDSSCGAYTDYQYKCTTCGKTWWIDGPDS